MTQPQPPEVTMTRSPACPVVHVDGGVGWVGPESGSIILFTEEPEFGPVNAENRTHITRMRRVVVLDLRMSRTTYAAIASIMMAQVKGTAPLPPEDGEEGEEEAPLAMEDHGGVPSVEAPGWLEPLPPGYL